MAANGWNIEFPRRFWWPSGSIFEKKNLILWSQSAAGAIGVAHDMSFSHAPFRFPRTVDRFKGAINSSVPLPWLELLFKKVGVPHSKHHQQNLSKPYQVLSVHSSKQAVRMANDDLAARVESLEAEMTFYRREIKELNTQIVQLTSTIRSLRRAVSNLQDFSFDQLDNKGDPEYTLGGDSEETAENSEGSPNGSDDRSDGANDASDRGSD
ncbi:hypothetical protein RHMOL_Rhmol10G0169400 [Rhododendron molle]|uniref:Uncharacterized protein n=1 Tax=Rhododendron molle TaxID=49168 RepID=A0ACC0M2Z6_RHOML|nr:hypothetical protein RHMOL_Rhmol10G0169400 [Rhododendron molle]